MLRTLSTEPAPPAPTATKEPSEIAPIPQKDVLSADVISGAPGTAVFFSKQWNTPLHITSSRTPPSRRAYIPTYSQHYAERWSKGEALAC